MCDDIYPKDKYYHSYLETFEVGARKIEMRDDLISGFSSDHGNSISSSINAPKGKDMQTLPDNLMDFLGNELTLLHTSNDFRYD